MTEGFRKRMSSIVGDENTVARYLTEKIGHTALIAWAIAVVTLASPLMAAVIAALAYVVVGKILWFVQHRTFDFGDFVFDLVVGLFPAVLALMRPTPLLGALALIAWAAGIAAGSNNQVGSPS